MWNWILKDSLRHIWLRTSYWLDWAFNTFIIMPILIIGVTLLLITGLLWVWDTKNTPEIIEMKNWREGFAILPFRINGRWVWLRPFWVCVNTTLTGKSRLIPGGRIHPQQQAYNEYQHHVELRFYSERDRMHYKLKHG